MCGHGSNPGPGHPRPAAANAQTRTRDGVAAAHRRNARPLVRSVPRVVRSGPQPPRFAPDAARSPRRPPGPYRHGLRKSPADGGDLSRLRCTSAASNWTSWNRPGRGGRGCGRQGAPVMPVRHCIHDDRPPVPILHFHCPKDWKRMQAR